MEVSQFQTSQQADQRSRANFMLSQFDVDSRTIGEDVLAGLKNNPKTISPKYFYDAEGSRLFDQICGLPEYYLTRTETSILERQAGAILDRLGRDLCIIELGAGACHKGSILLETGNVRSFIPVDISTEYLRGAALRVAHNFPHVSVHAVGMDFIVSIDSLESLLPEFGRRVIFYAGSSIGNFESLEARRLLSQFHKVLRKDDALLIGYDLKKNADLLKRAYNDSAGVTAAFNLNLLARFNRELGADFNVSAFRHAALYNESLGRVEMHLESVIAQEVNIVHECVSFDTFERIHTESSYKYSVAEFDEMAEEVGFESLGAWTDPANHFAVGLYTRGESCQPKSSTRDRAEGAFHEAKGKVKEMAGKIADSPKLEAKGTAKKIAGKAQDKGRSDQEGPGEVVRAAEESETDTDVQQSKRRKLPWILQRSSLSS